MKTHLHAEYFTGSTPSLVAEFVSDYLKGLKEQDIQGIVFNHDNTLGWSATVFVFKNER